MRSKMKLSTIYEHSHHPCETVMLCGCMFDKLLGNKKATLVKEKRVYLYVLTVTSYSLLPLN